jgi:hypothetical protein
MTSPDETPTAVDRELERARAQQPEPPPWFVATIMRRVQAWEAGQSAWRRWRRSARASNFSPAPRVGKPEVGIQLGGMVMKKVVWTVAALGALAIAAYVWVGYPPVGQGTDATIGAAQRYQAQAAPAAAPTADMSVQAFLQTDTFDRLTKNADTRHALKKAASDPAFKKALTDPAIIAVLARAEMRAAVTNELVYKAMGDKAFWDALAANNLEKAAVDPALIRAARESGLEAALADLAYRDLFANVAVRQGMAELAARGAFEDAAFMRAIAEPAMVQAMHMSALEVGLTRGSFASYLQER